MQTKVFKLSVANLPGGPNPYQTAINRIYEADANMAGFALVATFWDNPLDPQALVLVFQKPKA